MQDKKQEKVLHTRVSRELFEKVSTKARKHRVSTSNLIRNLVEDYLEIHGDVWDAIDNKLRNYLDKGEDSIIGYQSLILNKDTTCDLCNKKLKAGCFLKFNKDDSIQNTQRFTKERFKNEFLDLLNRKV